MEGLLADTTFWVAVGMAIFIAIIVWAGAPGLVARGLDAKADEIRREIEGARALHEEACALLARYQQKSREASQQIEDILGQARNEAAALAGEARKAAEQQLQRRTEAAERKITQAEADAVAGIRKLAAGLAAEAARHLIAARIQGDKASALVDQGIRDLRSRLH